MKYDRIFVGRKAELEKFTSMLEGEVRPWVFVLAGPGGIGKTWLLRRFISLSQSRGAVNAGLLDFHYTDMQAPVGLLGTIGERLGREHFPDLAEILHRSEVASAAEREETLAAAVESFAAGLRDLASERTVALFFDTLERATETGVAEWFLGEMLPQVRDNAVVVLAGRNTFRLTDFEGEAKGAAGYAPAYLPLSPEDVYLHTLSTFTLKEVRQYL